MPTPEEKSKATTDIRWKAGNLQIGDIIIPWQHCMVYLNTPYRFKDEDSDTKHCVVFRFNYPNFVPEAPPNPNKPEEWDYVLDGELAEAVRQFLYASATNS